jgi:hypothetical protein
MPASTNPSAWTVSTSADALGVSLALGGLTLTDDLGPREAERLAGALLAAADRVRRARLQFLAAHVLPDTRKGPACVVVGCGRDAVSGSDYRCTLHTDDLARLLAPYEQELNQ